MAKALRGTGLLARASSVPITAVAPPALPGWLGWTIGSIIPFLGLFAFLLLQPGRTGKQEAPTSVQALASSQVGSV